MKKEFVEMLSVGRKCIREAYEPFKNVGHTLNRSQRGIIVKPPCWSGFKKVLIHSFYRYLQIKKLHGDEIIVDGSRDSKKKRSFIHTNITDNDIADLKNSISGKQAIGI